MDTSARAQFPTSSAPSGAFRATADFQRSASHGQNLGLPQDQQQSSHDDAIEPSLANLAANEPFRPDSSQGEDVSFQLQLQAAVANSGDETMVPSTEQMAHDHAIRQRRLGRACDACSRRKVKCGDEVPCRNCTTLNIACTFVRPAKRRGPANKIAEDLKRARYEVNDLNTPPENKSVSAPALQLSMESIMPFEPLMALIYSYYTYIYPIFPFPHEHLTIERVKRLEDRQNHSFCGLVASMVAMSAVLHPAIVLQALNYHDQSTEQSVIEDVINRCMALCENSRSPLNASKNPDDAAMVFFMGVIANFRKQLGLSEMYLTEALAIVRLLGFEKEGPGGVNYVVREMNLRLYWAIHNFTSSLHQTSQQSNNTPMSSLIMALPHQPPLPLATEDYYIYHDRIPPNAPTGPICTIDFFNLLIRTHSLPRSLLRFEFFDDLERKTDAVATQEAQLITSLTTTLAPNALTPARPELAAELQDPSIDSSVFEPNLANGHDQTRAAIRLAVQKTLLAIARLSTRQYLLERLDKLPPQVILAHAKDREDMVRRIAEEAGELVGSLTVASFAPVARVAGAQVQYFLAGLRQSGEGRGVVEKWEGLLSGVR